ncbi:Zinc finger protein MAGPIE [Glycine soja]|nr:Zinc finger protein MAGPIE [Glycine soja]
MPVDLDNVSTASGEASVSSSGNLTVPPKPTTKKKRNLPGMPDPDAEVIALSPKTLMATNRFVCEICNKGFQRDQNLQLHRRGHNLPWKLRQRSSKEVRKRVYVCPEPTCVHHDPSRALGDLTGIKKHFCRKHGEKKWKCDKCSKKYAVQSDWKAHSKICGTREYKCDCGTLFSRRDSFITHRAFCDALAEESARSQPQTVAKASSESDSKAVTGDSSPPVAVEAPPPPVSSQSNSVVVPSSSLQTQKPAFTDLIRAMGHPDHPADLSRPSSSEPISLCLATNHGSSIFGTGRQERRQYAPPPQPAMSATALLQKAAQMGAAATNASFLRGLGIVSSSASTSSVQQDNLQWGHQPVEPESASVPAGLGLGLPCDSSSGLKELMMGTPSMFGPKQTTLDFLGLGMAAGGTPGGGLSALITSIGGGLDVTTAAASFASGEFPGKDIGRRST